MKKFISFAAYALLIVSATFTLSSCGGDDDDDMEEIEAIIKKLISEDEMRQMLLTTQWTGNYEETISEAVLGGSDGVVQSEKDEVQFFLGSSSSDYVITYKITKETFNTHLTENGPSYYTNETIYNYVYQEGDRIDITPDVPGDYSSGTVSMYYNKTENSTPVFRYRNVNLEEKSFEAKHASAKEDDPWITFKPEAK